MLKEVLLSYRIIFGQDNRSRKLFQASERKNIVGFVKHYDTLLDTLCGRGAGSNLNALGPFIWPSACCDTEGRLLEQDVYNVNIDMPIFGARLFELESFSLHQQPSSKRDLWRDRRNPLQWYTFWAVLIIGGLSLIIGILQLLVAIAQLATGR